MLGRRSSISSCIVALVAEGFLSRFSFGLAAFALPLYAHQLGLSLTEIGFLLSLHLTVSLVLKPVSGSIADRVGLKRALGVSIVLRSIVSLLLAFAAVPWQLFAIRVAHGASKSLRDPSVNALIAEHGGKKRIASTFAWYQTAKSVAGASGKGVAGILLTLTAGDYSLVFAVAFVFSLAPLFLVARRGVVTAKAGGEVAAKRNRQQGTPSRRHADRQVATESGGRKALAPFVGLGLLISCTAQMLHGLLPILAKEYAGLNEAQTGMLYMASTVIVLFSGPLFGWMSDTFGKSLVFTIRSVANAASSLLYWFLPSFAGFAAARIVDGVGKSAFRPAWGAMMAHVSSLDRRRRARTTGLMSMGEDAGDVLGPILGGFLWSTWGISALLITRIGLAIASEIYVLVVMRPTRKTRSSGSSPQPGGFTAGLGGGSWAGSATSSPGSARVPSQTG